MKHYFEPGMFLALTSLTYFILTAVLLGGRYYYFSSFTVIKVRHREVKFAPNYTTTMH